MPKAAGPDSRFSTSAPVAATKARQNHPAN
jgi:hypothetical protein